jgi:hypothetical protein
MVTENLLDNQLFKQHPKMIRAHRGRIVEQMSRDWLDWQHITTTMARRFALGVIE